MELADLDKCRCGAILTGTHVVEECPELEQWRPLGSECREWREALGGRARSEKVDVLPRDFLPPHLRRIPLFFSNPNIFSTPAVISVTSSPDTSVATITRSITPAIPVASVNSARPVT